MKITQSFAVIRYEKSMLFDDARTRNTIFKKLRGSFPVHDFNDQARIMIFFDPQKKIKCLIHPDNIVIDIDEPRDLGPLKSAVNEYVPFILKELDISNTEYIGVRGYFIPEMLLTQERTEHEIIQRYFSPAAVNMLGLENERNKNVGVTPRFGYTIQLEGGMSMNVNVGSNQKVQGEINPNGQINVQEVLETNPLIDLDAFVQVPKEILQINGVVKGACSQMEKYSGTVWNILAGSGIR